MQQLQVFSNNQFGEIRTIEHDGEIWFVGRDIAIALGYKQPETSVRDRVGEKDTEKFRTLTRGGEQELLYVNEAGLYSLIFGSKLESARQFQDWVTHDVLPSIRKTGGYRLPQTTEERVALALQCAADANQRIDKIESDFASFREDLPLFPSELEKIVKAVKKKGMDIVGGKESAAYPSCFRAVVRDIYAEIWRNFDVTSYKDVKRSDLERVGTMISSYTAPFFLADRIAEVNGEVAA